jgi:organic radical activating enzyme
MKQVREEVAGDVFTILIQQLRDQLFIIDTGQSEIIGESCLRNSDILGKEFEIDFLISTQKNLIEDAKQEIQRLVNKVKRKKEKVKKIKKKIVQKGKSSNFPSVSFNPLSFVRIHCALFISLMSNS